MKTIEEITEAVRALYHNTNEGPKQLAVMMTEFPNPRLPGGTYAPEHNPMDHDFIKELEDEAEELKAEIAVLQVELRAKDARIKELEAQLGDNDEG